MDGLLRVITKQYLLER